MKRPMRGATTALTSSITDSAPNTLSRAMDRSRPICVPSTVSAVNEVPQPIICVRPMPMIGPHSRFSDGGLNVVEGVALSTRCPAGTPARLSKHP